jgi:hypothetical protein
MNKEINNTMLRSICLIPDYVYEGQTFNMKVRFFVYTDKSLAVEQGAKALAFGMRVEIFALALTGPDETRWCVKVAHPSYK